jgi:hypothetical protein
VNYALVLIQAGENYGATIMRHFFRRRNPHDDDQTDQYADNAEYSEPGQYDDEYDELDDSAAYREPDIEPFVPVSGGYYEGDRTEEDEFVTQTVTVDPPPERRRRIRPRLPRFKLPGLNVDLDWSYLLLASFLFVAGIFGVLLKQDDITGDLEAWWPLVLVMAGVLWMLIALVRRQVASFLVGSAFAGMGLSLLLDTQDIAAVEETILGVVLVAVGLGIVIRGFLLRQQVS